MVILSKEDIIRTASSRKVADNILQNVTVWFLMEMDIECIFVDHDSHVVDWICDLTRSLSEAPYYEDATELHCVPKYAKKSLFRCFDSNVKLLFDLSLAILISAASFRMHDNDCCCFLIYYA